MDLPKTTRISEHKRAVQHLDMKNVLEAHIAENLDNKIL